MLTSILTKIWLVPSNNTYLVPSMNRKIVDFPNKKNVFIYFLKQTKL